MSHTDGAPEDAGKLYGFQLYKSVSAEIKHDAKLNTHSMPAPLDRGHSTPAPPPDEVIHTV